MVFKRGDHLRAITEGLAWIENSCKLEGVLKLFDNHVLAQPFFCRVLNAAYHLQLVQMDQIQANYPAIDLGDSTNRIAYQVTTERRGEKVQHTLDKFVEHKLDKQFDKLRILIVGDRQTTYKAVVVPAQIQFDCDRDIIGIQQLVKHIETIETQRLDQLQAIFSEELKHARVPSDLPSDRATPTLAPQRRTIPEKSAAEILANLKGVTPAYKFHERVKELYLGRWTREPGWQATVYSLPSELPGGSWVCSLREVDSDTLVMATTAEDISALRTGDAVTVSGRISGVWQALPVGLEDAIIVRGENVPIP